MRVRVERTAVRRVTGVSLGVGPAVVGAGDGVVDLLPEVRADVVDERPTGCGLHRERKRIAKAQEPDRFVDSGCGRVERVVGGDGSVGIDPQHLALQRRHVLGVRAVLVVADRDVELAVGTEVDGTAVVLIETRQRVDVEQHGFRRRRCGVADDGKAAHAVVCDGRGGRVIEVDVPVGRERRVERDAVETALPVAVDRKCDHRRREQHSGVDFAKLTALQCDEDAIPGGDCHRGRSGKWVRDLGLHEPARKRGCRRGRSRPRR